MAMFGQENILGQAFAAAVRSQSFEGQSESYLGRSMFAKNVDAVSNAGLKVYIDTEEYCTKATSGATPTMTSESADFAKGIAKRLAEAKADFAVGFYAINS